MKTISFVSIFFSLSLSFATAQTLGETLQSLEAQARELSQKYAQNPTWGQQQAADDLNRLSLQSQRLEAALAGRDAESVEELQRGLQAAMRRVATTGVLLPETDRAQITEMVESAEAVNQRLTQLRLRFGSKASMVSGSLSELSLQGDDGLRGVGYDNIQQLLIDVRDARQLASTLGNRRYYRFGPIGGGPDNLDSLQVRRFVQAGWDLERELSGNIQDISQSVPAWERFHTEYNRLGYPGYGWNVRRLERVMERLAEFYSLGQ